MEPKHIEVQVLGDTFGNVVHLYERDCSLQRRYQKVVEFTPAFSVPESVRQALYDDAVKIAKHVAMSMPVPWNSWWTGTDTTISSR